MKKLLGILAVLFLVVGFFLFGSNVPNADASTTSSTEAVFVTDDGGLTSDFPASLRLVVEEEDDEDDDEDEEEEDEDDEEEDEDDDEEDEEHEA